MADLTTDTARVYRLVADDSIHENPVAATTDLFEGMALATDAGGDLVAADGTLEFAGFAVKRADNNPGADAAIRCRNVKVGQAKLAIVTVALSDVDATIYASDSDTFTLSSTGGNAIGKVVEVTTAGTPGVAWVAFQALSHRSL